MTTQTQGHWRLVWVNDRIDRVLDAGLQNVGFRELALQVGREPDSGQRPCLGQECLRIKHPEKLSKKLCVYLMCCDVAMMVGAEAVGGVVAIRDCDLFSSRRVAEFGRSAVAWSTA